MNKHLEQMRAPMLEYLGLEEIATVCTRIPCNVEAMPKIIGAMRPQMDTRGGHPHMHTARKHQQAMDYIAERYELYRGKIRANFRGPVIFCMVAHRHLPKSAPKRRIAEQDTFKPDTSNIVKLVEDALNGVAYRDDSQIVGEIPMKAPRFGAFDWLEIEITYCEAKR